MEKIKINIDLVNDDQIFEEMYAQYLACLPAVKYARSLGITDEIAKDNIEKIIDFVNDVNYCKNCPGVKKCKKANPLLVSKVTFNNGKVSNQLSPCTKMLGAMEIEKNFYVRDFDDVLLEITIRDVDNNQTKNKVIKKYKDYILGKSDEWIYVTGSTNTGRSFLATALAVHFAKEKGEVAFIKSSIRFKEMNDLSFKDKDLFNEMLDKYCTIPFLIVDDFGSEYVNDFIRDGILLQILQQRSAKKLLTMFTSDYKIDEVVSLYAPNKNASIRAKQISNILKKECKDEIDLGSITVYL